MNGAPEAFRSAEFGLEIPLRSLRRDWNFGVRRCRATVNSMLSQDREKEISKLVDPVSGNLVSTPECGTRCEETSSTACLQRETRCPAIASPWRLWRSSARSPQRLRHPALSPPGRRLRWPPGSSASSRMRHRSCGAGGYSARSDRSSTYPGGKPLCESLDHPETRHGALGKNRSMGLAERWRG